MNILNYAPKSVYKGSDLIKFLVFVLFLEVYSILTYGTSIYQSNQDTSFWIKGLFTFILFITGALLIRWILRLFASLYYIPDDNEVCLNIEVSRALAALFPIVLFIRFNIDVYHMNATYLDYFESGMNLVTAIAFIGYLFSIFGIAETEEQRKEKDEKRKKRFKIIDSNINDQSK